MPKIRSDSFIDATEDSDAVYDPGQENKHLPPAFLVIEIPYHYEDDMCPMVRQVEPHCYGGHCHFKVIFWLLIFRRFVQVIDRYKEK